METFTMPQAGQTMEEGTIVRWHKSEGDAIARGDLLLEVETDKATVDVEATSDGTLRKILAAEGETIPVGKPIALIGDPSEDIEPALSAARAESGESSGGNGSTAAAPAPAPTAESTAGERTPPAASVEIDGRIKASPAARKAARDRGVDLASIGAGSGPGGRIVLTDLDRAAAAPDEPVCRPLSAMRKAIARNVTASKQHVPHFYMRLSIDAGPLHAFYQREKTARGCTLNDIIVLACGRAMRSFPALRSRYDGDNALEFPAANIGVAVALDEGLVVPVVLGVDRLSLSALAVKTREVIDKARKGQVANMGRSTLTVSNLGMLGVEEFTAIISGRDAAILAVGAIRETVLVEDGRMRPGRVMTLTLSADHRLLDGVVAARFLGELKRLLEDPASWIA